MSEKRPSGSAGRVLFVGTTHDAVPVLEKLVHSSARVVGVLTADRDGDGQDLELWRLVAGREIPVRPSRDLGAASTLRWVHGLAPDLVVCAGWPGRLPSTVLAVAARGVAGIHPGLLPQQRPHSAVSWSLLRGERVTGSTLLLLSPGPSGGDIVDQRQVAIAAGDTCATLAEKLARTGADLVLEHLPRLLAGTAPRRAQSVARRGAVLPPRTPEMGITSFDRTTPEVHDWIRGQTRPCPGAFAYLLGRRVTLWAAEPMEGRRTHAPPGTVLGVDEGGVVVTTRTGAIRLLEVQVPGVAAEPAVRWFAREQLTPGCVFAPVDKQTLAWALGRRPLRAPRRPRGRRQPREDPSAEVHAVPRAG